MNNKGIMLIGVIVIIVALSIAALGIATFLTEALRSNVINVNQKKALYMAQAGIMQAIADYNESGGGAGFWDSAQNENVGEEFYFHLGEDANFLLVDASAPQIDGQEYKRIHIKNINDTDTITITDMVVSWTFVGNLTEVTLAGASVWTGTETSPASIDIADTALATEDEYLGDDDQIWEFSADISGDIICTFIFSDGSQVKAYLLKDDLSGNSEFSITATGEIRSGTTVEARRTLTASYDIGTSEITSWQESQSHIIP
ncbi:hypothetical protein ACFL2J_01125 [Candidatus Omnitrophota bacterium]